MTQQPLFDPVCGEILFEAEVVATCQERGRAFAFKHIKCKMLFEREPAKYLDERGEPLVTPHRGADLAARASRPSGRRLWLALGALAAAGAAAAIVVRRPSGEAEAVEPAAATATSAPAPAAPTPIDPVAPESPPCVLARGHLARGDAAAAIAALEVCVTKEPGDSEARALLGVLYWQRDEAAAATDALLGYAAAGATEMPHEVRALLTAALDKRQRLSPLPPDGRYTVRAGDSLGDLAKSFYGDAHLYPAILEANSTLIATPEALEPGMVLAIPPPPDEERARLHRAAAARALRAAKAQEGTRGDTDQAAKQLEVGARLVAAANPGAAIDAYRRCLTLDPSFVEAHLGLGVAYRRLGRDREAAQAVLEYLNSPMKARDAARRKLVLGAAEP